MPVKFEARNDVALATNEKAQVEPQPGVYKKRWMRLLGTSFQVEIDNVIFIALDARGAFNDQILCSSREAWIHDPGPGKDFGIFDGGLITDGVAFAADVFDDVHGGAMEPAVEAEPGILVETGNVDDQRIAFPMADGIAVVAGVSFGIMRSSVGRHDAKRVSGDNLIQKNDRHTRRLNNAVGRADAGNAARFAEKRRIEFAFVGGELFHFREQFGFVGRLIRVGLAGPCAVVAAAISWLGRTEAADRSIGSGAAVPEPVKVGVAVRKSLELLRWCGRCLAL